MWESGKPLKQPSCPSWVPPVPALEKRIPSISRNDLSVSTYLDLHHQAEQKQMPCLCQWPQRRKKKNNKKNLPNIKTPIIFSRNLTAAYLKQFMTVKRGINTSCNAAMWLLKAGMISLKQAREEWVSRWFCNSAHQPAPVWWLRGWQARQADWWAGWMPTVTLTSCKTQPRPQIPKVNMERSNSWGKLLREGSRERTKHCGSKTPKNLCKPG